MSDILSIEKLREMACPVISIPDFTGEGKIKVRVQKPRLMAMAAQGQIPNYLMSVAMQIAGISKAKPKDPDMKDIANTMELYCRACLVEPTYEELKDIITDDQMSAIFDWAMGDIQKMSTFRPKPEDGAGNNNGEGVPKTAERNHGD